MRTPAHRGRRRLVATLAVVAALVAACAEAAVTPAPTIRPTPVITPDPHLADPTTADAVFLALGTAGLKLAANNASPGGEDGDLVKRINATYQGWPLSVSEFRTSQALLERTDWPDDARPGQGEPPVAIAGLNVLIEWGPTTGAEPKQPSGAQLQGLRDLASALRILISPLRARSIVAVPGVASQDSVASSGAPSGETEPETTPTPES